MEKLHKINELTRYFAANGDDFITANDKARAEYERVSNTQGQEGLHHQA